MRRPVLMHVALIGALFVVMMSGTALAQNHYPSRVVKIVVGYPAGSSVDILARIYAKKFSERLGGTFIVEDRPGASDTIATGIVAKAPADGYTLLLSVLADAIEASAFKHLNYNFAKDFSPIAGVASAPIVLVVRPDLKVSSVKDLIALAKKRPGKIFFGTSGIGATPYMAGELFDYLAGVKMVPVPYKGIPAALQDLLGGRIQAVFATAPTVAGFIKDGRLKAIAVTSDKRLQDMPKVPTVAESGLKNYDVVIWYGFVAPKGTPLSIRQKLASTIVAANAHPKIQRQLAAIGASPFSPTLGKFGTFIKSEIIKWKKVVRYAGVSLN